MGTCRESPDFFLNGVVPCTDHCANYIGTLSFMRDRQERGGNAWEGKENEYSDGQEKERKSGAMQLRIHAKASTHKCADKVHTSLWTLYPHESVDINCVENWSACMWINSPQINIHILTTNSPHDCG